MTPGDRVYIAHHPEDGSLTVTEVWHRPDGSIRIAAGRDGYSVHAEADCFAPWPAGLDEPPTLPMRYASADRSEDCREVDPMRFDQWCRDMEAWFRKLLGQRKAA